MTLFSSNFDELAAEIEARLLAPLTALGEGASESVVANAQAARGRELLAAMFVTSSAPSGEPWAPPARNHGHPLLYDTTALASSALVTFSVSATGHELTFSFSDVKAPWHNYGTSRMPARPIMFDDSTVSVWKTELDSVGQTALDSWLTASINL